LKYLQETARSQVKVAAYDALDEAVAEVKAGRLMVTVDQQAAEQGYQGIVLAKRLLNKEVVPETMLIDTRLISAASLK
jgi:ribose transport system substrate-binding protein